MGLGTSTSMHLPKLHVQQSTRRFYSPAVSFSTFDAQRLKGLGNVRNRGKMVCEFKIPEFKLRHEAAELKERKSTTL